MKPAIAFAVAPSPYRNGWRVVDVTSQNRSRIFGRDDMDRGTSLSTRQAIAVCQTRDEAELIKLKLQENAEGHRDRIRAAERAVTAARDAMASDAMAIVARVLQAAPAPACDKGEAGTWGRIVSKASAELTRLGA